VTELLGQEDAGLRARATKWLGRIQGPKALEALLAALQDKEHKVREAAMTSLGSFRDPRALEPLLGAVKDRHHPLRRVAAQALETMGWKPGADESGAHYWIVRWKWSECARIGAPAVGPLIGELAAEEWAVREAAAGVLGEIRDPRAVEPLLTAIRDAQKVHAGLEQRVSEEDTLAAYMNDESPGHSNYQETLRDLERFRRRMADAWHFVAAAILALGRIGDSRAAEAVRAALTHADPDVRAAAAAALSGIEERIPGSA
jgi:HEAT repeat protein